MKIIILYIIITFSFLTSLYSQTWERFTTDNSDLPKNLINNLLFDADDNLWINGYSSIFMYNDKKQEWITFNKSNSQIGEKIYSLYRDNYDNIWATSDVIYKFERQNNKWELFDTISNVSNIAVDDNGIIYIVRDMTIYYKNNGKWIQIFNGKEDNNLITPSTLLLDKNNTLWFGFSSNSFDFFSYKNNSLINHTKPDYNLPALVTADLCIDSSNNIWVVSDEEAKTYKYISTENKWKKFDSTNSPFGQDFLYSKGIETSKDNKVWLVPGKLFSLAPRFLTYHKNEEWKKYSIDDALDLGPKDELYLLALAIDSKNNVWIGTDKGLIKFNEAQTSVATFEQSNIKLYPNPTSEFMNIDLQENLITSYSILDLNGKIVKQQHHNFQNQITIDTKQLIAGTYFIKLKLSDNTYVQSKFVKE